MKLSEINWDPSENAPKEPEITANNPRKIIKAGLYAVALSSIVSAGNMIVNWKLEARYFQSPTYSAIIVKAEERSRLVSRLNDAFFREEKIDYSVYEATRNKLNEEIREIKESPEYLAEYAEFNRKKKIRSYVVLGGLVGIFRGGITSLFGLYLNQRKRAKLEDLRSESCQF